MNKFLATILTMAAFQSTSYGKEVVPQSLDLLCMTEFPTTSFIGETVNNRFNVRFVNSNGVKHMPIHSGLVTIEDIKLLEKRANVLKNLDDVSEFNFDVKSCTVYQDQTFRCANGSTFKTNNGTQFEAYSIRSSLVKIYFSDFQYDQVQVTASFIVNGETYDVPMNYGSLECGIHYK